MKSSIQSIFLRGNKDIRPEVHHTSYKKMFLLHINIQEIIHRYMIISIK